MAAKQKENPNLLSHHLVQGLTLAFQRAFHMFKIDFECGLSYVCLSMYVRICNQDQSSTFHEVFVRNIFSSQDLGFPSTILNSVFCKTKITKMPKCGSAEKSIVFCALWRLSLAANPWPSLGVSCTVSTSQET